MDTYAPESLHIAGLLIATIKVNPNEADLVKISGCQVKSDPESGLFIARRPNAFTTKGLQNILDRMFNISGPPTAPTHIGLSNDTAAASLATTLIDPTAGGGSPASPSIKAISPAASRASTTVTAGATFTQADVGFAITKVGLLNTSTDAGTGLYDVIGGTGGASPFNQPFSIDLTGTSSFSLVMQIQVTAAN